MSQTLRPKVPARILRKLLADAGGKCANPGCSATIVDLHHIKEWHTYRTHHPIDMIAVCPSCHAEVHRGTLSVDDETIRYWKSIRRPSIPRAQDHLYIERGGSCTVMLGSLYATNGPENPDGIIVFELSQSNRMSFRVVEGDIFFLNLTVADTAGHEIVRVTDNHLSRAVMEPIRLDRRTGKYQITAPATNEYIPSWVVAQFEKGNRPQELHRDGRFTLLDLEVVDRGVVKIQGVWVEGDRAIVIQRQSISICAPRFGGFVHVMGYGEHRGDYDLKNLPLFIHNAVTSSFLSAALDLSGF
jgi:hypothetical protein